jgi:uncharacterized RDD family membrane protein YckC
MSDIQTAMPASLGKRLLAIVYDLLIIIFLTFIVTLVIQQIIIHAELVPLEQVQINAAGDKVAVIPADSLVTAFLKSLGIIISFLYLVYYWSKRGQTPGMRVWRVKAIASNGTNPDGLQASLRYIFALFGLGLVWILFNQKRLALQDIMSKTRLIRVSQ